MSYEEFLSRVKEGIVTERGNCPITPLLIMLQGKWKNQVIHKKGGISCRFFMRS